MHRSDDSGTTKNFTDYLLKAADGAWSYDADSIWPKQSGEAAEGTSGLIASVKSGAGAIGYADESQAGGLGIAAIGVGEEFNKPSADGAAMVLANSPRTEGRADVDMAIDIDRTITDSGAYPLLLTSYLLACQHYDDANEAALVKGFLAYAVSSDGQQAAAEQAGSAPLDSTSPTRPRASVDKIPASREEPSRGHRDAAGRPPGRLAAARSATPAPDPSEQEQRDHHHRGRAPGEPTDGSWRPDLQGAGDGRRASRSGRAGRRVRLPRHRGHSRHEQAGASYGPLDSFRPYVAKLLFGTIFAAAGGAGDRGAGRAGHRAVHLPLRARGSRSRSPSSSTCSPPSRRSSSACGARGCSAPPVPVPLARRPPRLDPALRGPGLGHRQDLLTAGMVLAIMILPIITAISREIFAQTPRLNEEAALALGATKWEMIRHSVFPYARSGMVAAVMLGLGRALGETMAVAMVLSASLIVTFNMISSTNPATIAANIASSFAEATPGQAAVLIATGLVLFAFTFAVNFAARAIVARGERKFSDDHPRRATAARLHAADRAPAARLGARASSAARRRRVAGCWPCSPAGASPRSSPWPRSLFVVGLPLWPLVEGRAAPRPADDRRWSGRRSASR